MLDQLRQRAPKEQLQLIIQKDYEIWARANHVSTDITFRLSWLDTPKRVEDFCQQHDLNYSNQWVNDIVSDMNFYRTSNAV